MYESFSCSTFSSTFLFSAFDFRHPNGHRTVSHRGFKMQFLMINEAEHLFRRLFTIHIFSFVQCLFNHLQIFIRLLICLLLSCKRAWCILNTILLSAKCIPNIFIIVSCLFIFLRENFSFWKCPIYPFFLLCLYHFIYYSTFNFSSTLYDIVIVWIFQMIKLDLPEIMSVAQITHL